VVQAALALWRTKGYSETSVTDICKAAGVSKALFYVYFARKEDVLLHIEALTMSEARDAACAVLSAPYDVRDIVVAVVEQLEARARRFPADVIFEAVLETYRLERLALIGGATDADLAFIFLEPFQQARRDGVLHRDTDVERAARIAQGLVANGIRTWAATGATKDSVAEPLARDIADAIRGVRQPRPASNGRRPQHKGSRRVQEWHERGARDPDQ
jgi:AcrR family transcriptional regulator